MNIASCSSGNVIRKCLARPLRNPSRICIGGFNSHRHVRPWQQPGTIRLQHAGKKRIPPFWDEYNNSYDAPIPTLRFSKNVLLSGIGETVTAVGFLERVTVISKNMAFAQITGGHSRETIQLICRNQPELHAQLQCIPIGSSISITGVLGEKEKPKSKKGKVTGDSGHPRSTALYMDEAEIHLQELRCINSFPVDSTISPKGRDDSYGPENRDLMIRYNKGLREDLDFRSDVSAFIRDQLKDFQEIETPILFKSTPEGAREFLVPVKQKGFAYALPQSPQQYKQLLMASGISRYYQFAKCFRDEDHRADRQPEFTQIDFEMAWATGEDVMQRIESLVKSIYKEFASSKTSQLIALPDSPFQRMSYNEAMSKHGSDKPDLRIRGIIHDISDIVPDNLKGMLTNVSDPIIEVWKLEIDSTPKESRKFITSFLDSPEAKALTDGPEGAPGVNIYDSTAPLEGLQSFGHEGAELIKNLLSETGAELSDGQILILQAREKRPHTGGSTTLGNLRNAIYKKAISQDLLEKDETHRFLWVTDFPMFTPDDPDPTLGQRGTAGFSATHHPFTAPKTKADVQLLLTDPLSAKADHYDLVVNGVELGGGSRRIHNAQMQKFIMSDILGMSEERIGDFSHLLEALSHGCPPHSGLAIGFDRMIAVMRGKESVRDVIAFPKDKSGRDLLVNSPGQVGRDQASRYHMNVGGSEPGSEK